MYLLAGCIGSCQQQASIYGQFWLQKWISVLFYTYNTVLADLYLFRLDYLTLDLTT
jgi:hypothetical protein